MLVVRGFMLLFKGSRIESLCHAYLGVGIPVSVKIQLYFIVVILLALCSSIKWQGSWHTVFNKDCVDKLAKQTMPNSWISFLLFYVVAVYTNEPFSRRFLYLLTKTSTSYVLPRTACVSTDNLKFAIENCFCEVSQKNVCWKLISPKTFLAFGRRNSPSADRQVNLAEEPSFTTYLE